VRVCVFEHNHFMGPSFMPDNNGIIGDERCDSDIIPIVI